MRQAAGAHGAVNDIDRALDIAPLIGVLNAENKHAIVLFCKQISV